MLENSGLLRDAALKAMGNAYAPYSGYSVGAALLTEEGGIFAGCNVENASYGMSICAERAALVSAVSSGAREFRAVYIIARGDAPWPCGACRQVLNEFSADMLVIVEALGNPPVSKPLSELLPEAFRLDRK